MPDKPNPISELKVSGHAMTLDPGLYCVSNGPDSPAPSNIGLPGVRISAAPGAQPGQVDIATFAPDGWVGSDAAALVRITGAPSSIYVTIYQEPGGTAEAPRLQVLTLSAPQAVPQAAPQASRQAGRPMPRQPVPQQPAPRSGPAAIETLAHIYARGDVGGGLSTWIGEPGSNQWIEGFAVAPTSIPASDIEYQAVLGRGWLSPWAEGGQFCGSRGMSLPILGLRVKLRGDTARTHQVELSASFVDGTRIGPVHDGEACEAPSLAALEAFNLAIRQVKPAAAARAAKPAPAAPTAPTIKGRKAAKPAPEPVPVPAPARPKQAPKAAAPEPAPKARGKAKPVAPAPAPTRGAPAKRPPATRRR